MKIRVLSDLHINLNNELTPKWNNEDDTLTIIAGDVSDNIDLTHKWINDNFKNVIFIEGNHILYPVENKLPIHRIYKTLSEKFPKDSPITFLQDEYKVIDDVVFIGTTLWTDYSYKDSNEDPKILGARYLSSSPTGNGIYLKGEKAIPVDIEFFIGMYKNSINFIYETAKKFPDKKIVLIVHHAVSKKSISKNFIGHWTNSSAVTDIADELITNIPNIKLIIHGHVHQSHDYEINGVRILCNPLGRVEENENPNFKKDLIIEV